MDYTFPVVGGRITSNFGIRPAPTAGASVDHKGIDISVPSGTPVMAALSGIVKAAGYNSSFGNYITVVHGDGLETTYKHLSKVLTPKGGTPILEGQKIALSGNSGTSTGPHLDFSIWQNGKAVDPLKFNLPGGSMLDLFSGGVIDSDSILNVVKQNWWIIAAGLVVLALIKR